MPSYRLLAGDVTVLDTFAAEHDGKAIDCARELSLELPWERASFVVRWRYFRLERQLDEGWRFLFAWVPGDPTVGDVSDTT